MKNAVKISLFNFKTNRRLLLGWCIAVFSIMFLYTVLFPSMQDMAQMKLDSMPKELLQFVGLDSFSDMSNYIAYFGMIFNIVLIAISIFAAVFSGGLINKEERSKSIEFLNSFPVSRGEIYFAKYITAFLGTLLVLACGILAGLICGFIGGGDSFVLMDFIAIAKISSFSAFFFMSITFAVCGIFGKISGAAVGSMAVLVSYMMGYLGALLENKGEFLRYLSPFEMFAPRNAISPSAETVAALCVYIGLFVLLSFAGYLGYKKRDFVI